MILDFLLNEFYYSMSICIIFSQIWDFSEVWKTLSQNVVRGVADLVGITAVFLFLSLFKCERRHEADNFTLMSIQFVVLFHLMLAVLNNKNGLNIFTGYMDDVTTFISESNSFPLLRNIIYTISSLIKALYQTIRTAGCIYCSTGNSEIVLRKAPKYIFNRVESINCLCSLDSASARHQLTRIPYYRTI